LEGLVDGGVDKAGKKIAPTIKDFKSVSTEINVDILVQFPKGALAKMTPEAIEKTLKLSTTVSSTNMHMFNAECKLHKYASVEEIIDEFSVVRLEFYQKRKTAMVDEMQQKLVKLTNRARYIMETLDGAIDLRRMPNVAIVKMMGERGYDMLDDDYNYLVKMPMDSVSEENAHNIMQEREKTEEELATLMATTCEQMWMAELVNFETEYAKYKIGREMLQRPSAVLKTADGKRKMVIIRKK
jgi:DNA topoisomerase-2